MSRAASLLLVAFLAVSCGGGRGTVEAGGATTTRPSGPSTTVTTIGGTDPALAAKAAAATLQASDFTAGFEAQPDGPGQGLNIDLLWAELTACLGVTRTAAPAGVATSPTYLQGLATQGRSTVEYLGGPAATALAAALDSPTSPGCVKKSFEADLERSKPEGATAGPVTVSRRTDTGTSPRIMSWRVNASANLDDLVVPLFQDFLVIIDGGTVIRMFFLNPGSEFPQGLERSIVDKVVARASVPGG